MSLSRWILRGALALPVVLLAIVGYRTWRLEGAQAEIEDRRAARGIALGLVQDLVRWRDGESWSGERLAGAAADPLPARDAGDTLALARAELDHRLEGGDRAAAESWLESIEGVDDGGQKLKVWATLQRAALLRAAGDQRAATDLWSAVAADEDAARCRDERGLRLDLVARSLLLLRAEATDADALGGLALALAGDRMFAEERAMAALCERVLDRHAGVASAMAHRNLVARIDDLRERAHWHSARRAGLDRGLGLDPGSGATLRWVRRDRYAWLVVDGGQGSAAASLRGISRTALSRRLFGGSTAEQLTELGFEVALSDPDGVVLVTSRGGGGSGTEGVVASRALARVEAPTAAGALVVGVAPDSVTAERRASRRRRWLWMLGLLVVVAFATAFFGLRTLRKQERLAEERAGFVAAVSHELRTPLTSTRLLGELLERGGLDDGKVREFGGRIARESEHLAQLVHNVLDLARLERVGLQPEDTEEIAAEQLLREAADLVVGEGPPVRVLASTEVGSVRVHREAVLAALRNLIENARHHAAESPAIELAVVAAGTGIRCEVRDRGPGVAAGERAAIFREFRRESARDRHTEDTRSASGGAGLGLALVARIARVHRGRAFHEPRAGGGSVFVLELPRVSEDGERQ